MKEDLTRYSDLFCLNSRSSLVATVSHHIIHYSINVCIRGFSCTLCFRQISEKEYYQINSSVYVANGGHYYARLIKIHIHSIAFDRIVYREIQLIASR